VTAARKTGRKTGRTTAAQSEARKVLSATGAALLVAATLLLFAVLPAEYGWDPTGVGERLGLTGFSQSGPAALVVHDAAPHSDNIAFALAPFEAVEYKYRMAAGDSLFYSWRSQGEVVYDMHAEPDGAAKGYAESFHKGRAQSGHGSYRAAYDGIHGWFWQNRGSAEVTVTLGTRGYHQGAIEFRDGREFEYDAGTQP